MPRFACGIRRPAVLAMQRCGDRNSRWDEVARVIGQAAPAETFVRQLFAAVLTLFLGSRRPAIAYGEKWLPEHPLIPLSPCGRSRRGMAQAGPACPVPKGKRCNTQFLGFCTHQAVSHQPQQLPS